MTSRRGALTSPEYGAETARMDRTAPSTPASRRSRQRLGVLGALALATDVVADELVLGTAREAHEDRMRLLAEDVLAMATRANALSTASINISMQVRATWRRLHGLDAHFLQDALPQKGTSNDPTSRPRPKDATDSD